MKCLKCGEELSDDAKFCSNCGTRTEKNKIVEDISSMSDEKKNDKRDSSNCTNSYLSAAKATTEKKSIADRAKEKGFEFWNKLCLFGKATTVCIVIFIFSCFLAFMAGKLFAGIIAMLQIALVVVAILMKKQIIKTPKSWLHIAVIIIALILAIPYYSLFGAKTVDGEKIVWSEIVLNEVIPEPKSNIGEIYSNDSEYLLMDVYKTSEKQYSNYIDNCKDTGFTVDVYESDVMFDAYNDAGYELSLYYYESDSQFEISINAPVKLGTLAWPEEGLALLLPSPNSKTGRVDEDNEKGFIAYVGDTTLATFSEYIQLCSEMGFSLEEDQTEKHFSAKNADGYKLNVDYQGNNVISIFIDEPEYNIDIKVECVENWIFSQYDVDVYIDDFYEGTIVHGGTEMYSITLTKGTYELKFVDVEDDTVIGEISMEIARDESFEYKISCSSSGISVDAIGEEDSVVDKEIEEKEITESINDQDAEEKSMTEGTTEPEVEENLTVDNCEDLATILSIKSESDPAYISFASKYKGKLIEFDGSIDYMTNHENYKTRYEMLVTVGDYDADHQIGPYFKFDEIATYEIDYGNQNSVSTGTNIHIVAEVESFNTNSNLLFLDPVSISVR